MKKKAKLPAGWDEARVRKLIRVPSVSVRESTSGTSVGS